MAATSRSQTLRSLRWVPSLHGTQGSHLWLTIDFQLEELPLEQEFIQFHPKNPGVATALYKTWWEHMWSRWASGTGGQRRGTSCYKQNNRVLILASPHYPFTIFHQPGGAICLPCPSQDSKKSSQILQYKYMNKWWGEERKKRSRWKMNKAATKVSLPAERVTHSLHLSPETCAKSSSLWSKADPAVERELGQTQEERYSWPFTTKIMLSSPNLVCESGEAGGFCRGRTPESCSALPRYLSSWRWEAASLSLGGQSTLLPGIYKVRCCCWA